MSGRRRVDRTGPMSTWGQIGGIVGAVIGAAVGIVWGHHHLGRWDWLWAGGGATAGGVAGGTGGLIAGWLMAGRPAREDSLDPVEVTQLVLEWRKALAIRICSRRGAQLDRLAAITHHISLVASDTTSGPPAPGSTVARLKLTGRSTLDELPGLWGYGGRRIVLLGEPGAGKSFAALELVVATSNAAASNDGQLVDLFLLADWYRWHLDHRTGTLGEWLAEQLVVDYQVPPIIARQLVADHHVIPVLDGMDEVPTSAARLTCKNLIDGYSGKHSQHGFFLTCRVKEYQELHPDWVDDDDTLTIRPLGAAQIKDAIGSTPNLHPGWGEIMTSLDGPSGSPLTRLFATPLRLTTALDAYANLDPRELAELEVDEAADHIWARYLTPSPTVTYRHHPIAHIHDWLTFLATAMEATDRQTMAIHELSYLDPQRDRHRIQYRVVLGLIIGVVYGIGSWLVAGPVYALVSGLYSGFGPIVLAGTDVARAVRVPMVTRLRAAVDGRSGTLGVAITAGLLVWFFFGPKEALTATLAMTLFLGTLDAIDGGVVRYSPDVTSEFESGTPRRPLTASARLGLGSSLFVVLFVALVGTLVGALVDVLPGGSLGGLYVGFFAGMYVAVFVALLFGPSAVVYYWMLSRQLDRHGLFPTRPDLFLEWCAGTRDPTGESGTSQLDRRWIRQAGAQFQFRHRTLQEFLARRETRLPPPPGP
jgi:hypothetical protein